MVRKLCLDHLTAADVTPRELVELASKHQCPYVSLMVEPYKGLVKHDLKNDTAERRAVIEGCREHGVEVDTLEVLFLEADTEVASFLPALRAGALLGCKHVVTLTTDADFDRLASNYRTLCGMAKDHGMSVLIEPVRTSTMPNLRTAAGFIENYDIDARVALDALHFFRARCSLEELNTYRSWVGRVQLCDGTATVADNKEYFKEAAFRRLMPGKGEWPLREFVSALSPDIVIGIEIPDVTLSPDERVRQAFETTRNLIASVEPTRS